MGRPPKAPDEKRTQVNIRLLPADKDKLENLAIEIGKPVATTAETIIANYLSRRPETNALLDRIAQQIADLEAKASGKWRKNLKAWAAVSEMLSTIIEDDRPERIRDDEIAEPILKEVVALRLKRSAAIKLLAQRGVSIQEDPISNALLGGYMRQGIFGSTPQHLRSSRTWERAAVEAMPDGDEKDDCRFLFDYVEDMDAAIAKRSNDYSEAIRPYIVAEQEGRQLARPMNALATRPIPALTRVPAQKGALSALLEAAYAESGEEAD